MARNFAAAYEQYESIDRAWGAIPEKNYTAEIERSFIARNLAAYQALCRAKISTSADLDAVLQWGAKNPNAYALPSILARARAAVGSTQLLQAA
jgi:hypothetical protein